MQVLKQLLAVHGAGQATAERWWAQGVRSVADLAHRQDLTEQQKLGVKYYEDFLQRIPRTEARWTDLSLTPEFFDMRCRCVI